MSWPMANYREASGLPFATAVANGCKPSPGPIVVFSEMLLGFVDHGIS